MFSYLKLLMIENKISISKMAKILKISPSTMSKKLNQKTSFDISEMILIRDTYFPSLSLEVLTATSKDA